MTALHGWTANITRGGCSEWSSVLDGHLDIKYLISQGAEVNQGDNDGVTALHRAAQNGHLDTTQYLSQSR